MPAEALQYQPQPQDSISYVASNISTFPRQHAQYDLGHDTRMAREINNISFIEDYMKRKEQFLSYIPKQVETALSERFNVELSRFEYDIKDGQLWGKDMDEPFIDSMKRGRDYRRKNGNPIDYSREAAEVTGFEKIQNTLLDSETPIGTMMLSISPKGEEGSTYGNNFYDIFILKKTESGKRYIEARRYASGVKGDEYQSLLMPFCNIQVDNNDIAASLLANPIAIQNSFSPENLHQYLQKNHGAMSEERFAIINKHCEGLKRKFAQSLLDNPDDVATLKREFNAVLNKADEIDRLIDRDGMETWKKISPISTRMSVAQDITEYGNKEVRKVMTGCGMSSGLDIERRKDSLFSVAEFGKKWDYHKGDCVVCKRTNLEVGPCEICKKCEAKFDEEG